MINNEKLRFILEKYKRNFTKYFDGDNDKEKFKWEAVKHFQEYWNIEDKNFGEMFKKATDKTDSLLSSNYAYPRGMIIDFASADVEATRNMFRILFDESIDLAERVYLFQQAAEEIRIKNDDGTWNKHYQNTNAISTYLWLRYPDKYYIYKYELYRAVADELESDYTPKANGSADSMIGGFKMYDEICAVITKDIEIKEILRKELTDSCYPDPKLKTLTIDVGFFISRYLHDNNSDPGTDEWFPADYTPALTVDDWEGLLNDNDVFTNNSLEIMKRMLDYGGQATCTQLSIKYGESIGFYNLGSSMLAKRIHKKTDCPVMPRNEENSRWWPILYVGKSAGKDDKGGYIWKLRDELKEALGRIDLSHIKLFSEEEKEHNYWFLNASPKIWSMASMPVGDIQNYTLYNDNGNKRRIFQNFLDAKAGDMVIGYESSPIKQICALLKVSAEQDGEKIYFEKLEGLSNPIDFSTLKECNELEKMEYFSNQGSLFKLTKDEYEFILDMIREYNPAQSEDEKEKYDKDEFLKDVYISEAKYDRLVAVLKKKKNIILQGAPGVGKTYAAKRLAYSLMGEKDEDRIEFVQFHQNYSYEDFIMGYKPVEDGFELKYGIFYQFCRKASNHPEKDYFFIIDEINRGNLSKIFGELLMLIEADYRDKEATLAYNGVGFSVPSNLHIIGMMNTADRSLAMIDYALRRRFSFFDMNPGFDSEGFIEYQKTFNNETFDALINRIKDLNNEIINDKSLGKGFCIGHSYFCNAKECTDEWMKDVVDYDILPMLSEYWFDENEKLQRWENILHGVFQ